MRPLRLADPQFDGNEHRYVQEAMNSTWISGTGPFIERFEEAWASYCGTKYGIATCNGTAALHLALLAVGIEPGDEVIVPDLTFAATANAVVHCGATPIFCDVDGLTWTMDVDDLEWRITYHTKAILPVHLYGHPSKMATLEGFCDSYGVDFVDDAAQAHGATYKGRMIGGLADATAWSFHAAKIITTGEGGMVTTNNKTLADTMRLLRDHGMDPERRYWHPVIGYNYRMTNLHAAIGLAQVEKIDAIVAKRAQVIRWYREHLAGTNLQLPNEPANATNVCWLFSVILPEDVDRQVVMDRLAEQRIQSRPFFYPLHHLPPYAKGYDPEAFPVTRHLSEHGLSLPASASLTEEEVAYIVQALKAALADLRAA